MAFDAGSIIARLKLDKSQFTAGMASAKKETREFGSLLARGGAIVPGLALVAKGMYEVAQSGARIADTRAAFQNLARVAEVDGRAIIEQTRGISGALTEQQIVKAANMLQVLGVGMEKLPRLTEIARSSAAALGQDTSFMLESLTMGTARQSNILLKNLGIVIDVEAANRKYAAALGKDVKALSETETRAAFLSAVLSQGRTIIEQVGIGAETTSEKIAKIGRSFTDAADAAKTFFAELVTGDRRAAGILAGFLAGAFPSGRGGPFILPGRRTPTAGRGLNESIFPAVQNAIKLHKEMEAAAQAARDYIAALAAGGPLRPEVARLGAAPFPSAMEGRPILRGIAPAPVDWTQFEAPELTFGDEIVNQVDFAAQALNGLGDSFANLFETLITDSENAGKAFAATLLAGIGNVAAGMGDFMIATGIGTLAFSALNPFAMIGAGLALKALSGALRGISFLSAPRSAAVPGARQLRQPLLGEGERGGRVNIYVDNFIGNKAWLETFMQSVNKQLRTSGHAAVFFQGAT